MTTPYILSEADLEKWIDLKSLVITPISYTKTNIDQTITEYTEFKFGYSSTEYVLEYLLRVALREVGYKIINQTDKLDKDGIISVQSFYTNIKYSTWINMMKEIKARNNVVYELIEYPSTEDDDDADDDSDNPAD